MLQQSAKTSLKLNGPTLECYLMPERLYNNKLQARCPAAWREIEFCSFCRGHVVHLEGDLNEHMGMYKYTRLLLYKLTSGIGFLVAVVLVNGFNGPALTSLTAVKMHNSRVELLQRWSMSDGQHGDASLHACAIQLHLPICTDLQVCIQISVYVMC